MFFLYDVVSEGFITGKKYLTEKQHYKVNITTPGRAGAGLEQNYVPESGAGKFGKPYFLKGEEKSNAI